MIKEIKRSKLVSKVSLALHAAAEEFNCKNTNLDTLELYLLDPYIRGELEVLLRLSPQERGYKVLLVEPHYKSLLAQEGVLENGVQKSSAILTVLDLYHYPLRGLEQAEFMMERLPELRNIYQER
ncbi:MAG: hypothetical protein P0S96_02915 [Simkaniaceae bacterium]|nr:hypothetical protein [Candidatus Sacchlamyda saccharinae]